MAVRLFIGNLPYGASEADLRAHFSAVAEPSHIVMPVDRETGRPRGFAFVEFAERTAAEEVIKRFDAQPFQGRSLAVSEARAREDRPPPRPGGFSPRRPGGGFGGPRPGGGFGGGGRWLRRAAAAVAAALVDHARWWRALAGRVRAAVVRRTAGTRRPRSQRQLRPARTAQAAARRQEGRLAAGAASRAARSRSAAAAASTPWTISRDDSTIEIDDVATSAKDADDIEATDVDVETKDADDQGED